MASIIGTTGNDTLIDLSGVDDTIWGDRQGTLLGLGGNDRIYGRAGNDTIYGDADVIGPQGRGGNDYLLGGDGQDTLYGDASGSLFGTGGNDVVQQNAVGGLAVGDAQVLEAGSHGGDDRLVNTGFLYGDAVDRLRGNSIGGNDVLDAVASLQGSSLYGDANVLADSSRGGNDKLMGGTFTDSLYGDAGSALFSTSRGGNDKLAGNSGIDTLFGDAGGMTDFAVGGNDILRGGADNDFLSGDATGLTGSARGGNDKLYGGTGNDQLWGDGALAGDAVGGNDRFYFEGSFGDDTINDFRQGEDKLVLTGYQPFELQITVVGSDTVLTTLGDDSITLVGFTGPLTYGSDIIFN